MSLNKFICSSTSVPVMRSSQHLLVVAYTSKHRIHETKFAAAITVAKVHSSGQAKELQRK